MAVINLLSRGHRYPYPPLISETLMNTTRAADAWFFATAKKFFKADADRLLAENPRAPRIVTGTSNALTSSVVNTDFFGFDTSNNHYGLQGLGFVSETGDAVLGLVAEQMGADAPRWVAVRNVSDPQINAEGTLRDQAKLAARISKGFGRWSSVCSCSLLGAHCGRVS